MDNSTLESLLQINLVEFLTATVVSSIYGYIQSKDNNEKSLMNQSEPKKLFSGILFAQIKNILTIPPLYQSLDFKTGYLKMHSGDIGDILGWYAGLHIGKRIYNLTPKRNS